MSESTVVPVWVYRVSRKADTFLYLSAEEDFERLPDGLRTALGELSFVLQVDLDIQRTLPNADVDRVMADLRTRGFYLQLPKETMPFEGLSETSH